MERKLASIQKVLNVVPIEGADAIERIDILGWHLVAKKGQFKIGDLAIYCEIDSVLPDRPEFEFLREHKFRIKTRKFRGQISQGICFPIKDLIPDDTKFGEGDDVTEILEIIKWEPELSFTQSLQSRGHLPGCFPKTDEIRIQSVPDVLKRHRGIDVYVTEKLDGTSISVWKKDGEIGVGSRRMWLKEGDNFFWNAAKKCGILDRIAEGFCFQGELIGPGIQKNRYGLKEHKIFWFNVYNINAGSFLDFLDFKNMIYDFGLQIVPFEIITKLNYSVDELVELAKRKSKLANVHREGIVIRSIHEMDDPELGRLSFKVINTDFLLKYED